MYRGYMQILCHFIQEYWKIHGNLVDLGDLRAFRILGHNWTAIRFLLFNAISTWTFFRFCLFFLIFPFCLCYPRYLTKLYSSPKHLAKFYHISLNHDIVSHFDALQLNFWFATSHTKSRFHLFLLPSISLTEVFCFLVFGCHQGQAS